MLPVIDLIKGGKIMEDTCCICGKYVPEGRNVCPQCERAAMRPPADIIALPEPKSGLKHDRFAIGIGIMNALMLIAILVKVISL